MGEVCSKSDTHIGFLPFSLLLTPLWERSVLHRTQIESSSLPPSLSPHLRRDMFYIGQHIELLKALDPTRKTQSRLYAEIAHASIAAIVCVRLYACVSVCVRFRSSACAYVRTIARTCVRSHLRACEVHLIKDHQIKLRTHAYVHTRTYMYVHIQ